MVTLCSRCDLETTARNCTVQNGAPCRACEVDVLRPPRGALQHENCPKTRAMRNTRYDPFILKLPPEIASHIFILLMGDRDNGDVCQRRNGLPTPFLLGAVCSGWRKLARSTPALWSRLAFTFSDSMLIKNKINTPHLIADWLGRSGALPLNLQFSYDGEGYNGYVYPSDRRNRWLSVMDTLRMYSEWWYEAGFTLPAHYIAALHGTAPPNNLRTLTFSNIKDWKLDNIFLDFKMTTDPSPTNFKMDGFCLKYVHISWDKLVHLELDRTPVDNVLRVKQDAPLLETCLLFRISSFNGDFPTTTGTTICHPQIRTLAVSPWDVDVFTELLNSLELPCLESCELRSHSEDKVVMLVDTVVLFVKRSACVLKTLNLRCNLVNYSDDEPSLGIEDVEELFRAVPHLQHRLSAHEVSCYQ